MLKKKKKNNNNIDCRSWSFEKGLDCYGSRFCKPGNKVSSYSVVFEVCISFNSLSVFHLSSIFLHITHFGDIQSYWLDSVNLDWVGLGEDPQDSTLGNVWLSQKLFSIIPLSISLSN